MANTEYMDPFQNITEGETEPSVIITESDASPDVEEEVVTEVEEPSWVDKVKTAFGNLDATDLSQALSAGYQFMPGAYNPRLEEARTEEALTTDERRRDLIAAQMATLGLDNPGYESSDRRVAGKFVAEPQISKLITGKEHYKAGFSLTKEQMETAYSQSIEPLPNGRGPRKVYIVYDDKADPLTGYGQMLVSIEGDDGKMLPFARPAVGFMDWSQRVMPFMLAESGYGAAAVAAAGKAGRMTAKIPGPYSKALSPIVAISVLYSMGVGSEKLRNELNEKIGIKPEDDESYWNVINGITEVVTAPVPEFLGGPELTKEEELSGLMELLFGFWPTGSQQLQLSKRAALQEINNKLTKPSTEVATNTFRSAKEANEFRLKFKLGKLLPTQITANKIIQRFGSLSEQVSNVIAGEFRKQNREFLKFIDKLRDGTIPQLGTTKGGGNLKKFQDAFKEFTTFIGKVNTADIGKANAELMLLFRDLRRMEVQGLYNRAHTTIGHRSMDLNNIVAHISRGRKVVVPEGASDAKIVGTQHAGDWDDGQFNSILEQLTKLGTVNKDGNRVLSRQAISTGIKDFVSQVDWIDSVKQSYHDTPAKLLHLYQSKLGEMASGLIDAYPVGGGKPMPQGVKQRITQIKELRNVINETIRTPILSDKSARLKNLSAEEKLLAEQEYLKTVREDLDNANKFFQETENMTSQELINKHMDAVTGRQQAELQTLPEVIIGTQGGDPPKSVPMRTLASISELEKYVKTRLDELVELGKPYTPKSQILETKGSTLIPAEYQGLEELKKGFAVILGSKLKRMVTPEGSDKIPITEVRRYLDSFNDNALELLGISAVEKERLLKEAQSLAKLENSLAQGIAAKEPTTQFSKAISSLFDDPSDVETQVKRLLQVVYKKEGIRPGKQQENLKSGIIDYIFGDDSGVIKDVGKNSAYGEVGDRTIDPAVLNNIVKQITGNPSLKKLMGEDTVTILKGINNYAQVIQSTGADAGSALSGAQLIANLYTLDPYKFITVITKIRAQKTMAQVLSSESLADALLGQLKIANSGNEAAIQKMITEQGYLGTTLAKAVLALERDRETRSDEAAQTDRLLNNSIGSTDSGYMDPFANF
tara:strand:+ start:3858 stop:7175 length:3318 start_codon:yes stop_codon:yes gene_type:complete